jgi:hypothetical protein
MFTPERARALIPQEERLQIAVYALAVGRRRPNERRQLDLPPGNNN